jgi:cyclohexanone monooxygenase
MNRPERFDQIAAGSGLSLNKTGAPRIAVIGGGFSGIAAGYYLKRAKLENFLIFEASGDLGGTWNDNRYPGSEVDTASHLYCFSFNRNDWSRSHASQAELKRYLEKTVDEFSLRAHFRFGAAVVSAEWSDREGRYTVRFADGRSADFEAVISCVGFLNVPFIPNHVDMAAYPGVICHTSAWRDDISLEGKRVGVVGTGSSAVQVVPEAAKVARSVTVFQRSPAWVFPKRNRIFTARQRARYAISWRYRWKFIREFWKYEKVRIFGDQERPGSRASERMRAFAEAYLRRSLEGRPDLIGKLTPDYPLYAKRPVLSDSYYPALRRENVSLAPAVERIDAQGLLDAHGNRHELDIVVLATGFRASAYLSRLKVVGRGGADLHETWNGEPAAFLGSCVPGFPNLFMIYGPNSNAGPAVFLMECQAKFAARNIAAMMGKGATTVEVKQSAFDRFNAWIQARLETSVFKSTSSYYLSPSGKVVTQWPFSTARFWWVSRIHRRSAMTFR